MLQLNSVFLNKRMIQYKTTYRTVFLLTIIFVISTCSYSQKLNFIHYSVGNGLSSNKVNNIYQDSKGFLWFATDRGVDRFDGNQFEHFSLQDGLTDNDVFRIVEDSKHRIWFLTYNGKPCFLQNGLIQNKIFGLKLEHKSINSKITSILEKDDFILFGTQGDGLMKVSKKAVENILSLCPEGVLPSPSNNIYEIIDAPNNTIMINEFGISGENALCLDGIFYSKKSKNSECFVTTFNQETFVFKEQLYKLNKSKLEPISFPNLQHNATTFNIDKEKNYWIGTRYGATKYTIENEAFVLKNSFLTNEHITSVLNDKEGNLWFCTSDNGVFCLPIYGTGKLLNGPVSDLSVKNNQILYTKNNAVVYNINGDSLIYSFPNVKKIINLVSTKHSTLYVLDNSNIIYEANKKLRYFNFKVKQALTKNDAIFFNNDKAIYKLIEFKDSIGTKMIVEQKGIKLFDFEGNTFYCWLENDEFIKINLKNQDFSNLNLPFLDKKVVQSFSIENNQLWIATDKGFYKYNLNDFLYDKINEKNVHKFKLELPIIWMCTNEGVICYNINNQKSTIISERNGLLSNVVTSLEVLHDSVYIGTIKGLQVFSKEAIINTRTSTPEIHVVNNKPIIIKNPNDKVEVNVQGVHISQSEQLAYRYKLSKDSSWNYSKSGEISITELPEGKHNLEVQATVDGNTWSDKKPIPIQVEFSFWDKYKFYFLILLLLIILSLGYYVIKYYTNKSEDKKSEATLNQENNSTINEPKFFFLKYDGKTEKIFEDEVMYIKSAREYVEFFCTNKKILTLMNMQTALELLPTKSNFSRLHRSYIINIQYISSISPKSVFINDIEIKVGNTYNEEFNKIKTQFNSKQKLTTTT